MAVVNELRMQNGLPGYTPEPSLSNVARAHSCDLAVHGHAHHGTERGATPGGVPVRNVARPVIRHSFKVYELEATRARAASAIVEGEA